MFSFRFSLMEEEHHFVSAGFRVGFVVALTALLVFQRKHCFWYTTKHHHLFTLLLFLLRHPLTLTDQNTFCNNKYDHNITFYLADSPTISLKPFDTNQRKLLLVTIFFLAHIVSQHRRRSWVHEISQNISGYDS